VGGAERRGAWAVRSSLSSPARFHGASFRPAARAAPPAQPSGGQFGWRCSVSHMADCSKKPGNIGCRGAQRAPPGRNLAARGGSAGPLRTKGTTHVSGMNRPQASWFLSETAELVTEVETFTFASERSV
jgi:hypothetical protein